MMPVRSRLGSGPSRRPRRPRAGVFASLVLELPAAPPLRGRRAGILLASLIMSGVLAGALWRPEPEKAPNPDDVFVFEEEIPPPPPEIPPPQPPPMPEPPPRVEPPPEPEPPPPQFGLEEDDLSEAGDLAVATGNTLMKEAEEEVEPPPPPLPPSPLMMDQPPRILKGEPPEYPARALDRGLEGTVVVLITIDTAGRVTKAEIERSGGRDFDQAVQASVRGTLFQPPVRNGRKLQARFRRPYEFRLE